MEFKFIEDLPINEKYKDILKNNLPSDLTIYDKFAKMTIKKFTIWNEGNYKDFIKELHSFTISFLGYTEFILDSKLGIGIGYGVVYSLLKEFYDEFKNKGEIISPINKIENENAEIEEKSYMNLDELLKNGIIVIPGPKHIQKEIKKFNEEQIEFVNPAEKECVMGGFGAYGNPTSFHHPEIRNIRRIVHDYLWERLLETFPGRRAELLLDRFSKRRKGTSTQSESWHRDITNSKNVLPGDIIYGGWINLDPKGSDPQGFSCVPGTQIDRTDETGFVRFSEDEVKELNKKKKVFTVLPGHIIMFNQNIAHEVLKKTSQIDSYRLYIGWRITDGKVPLYDNTKVIEKQGIITLPGGMKPPMYSPSHWMFHREKLVEWSKHVKPEFREEKLFKKEGTYLDVVQQYMISLKEAGMPLWPEYTDYDKKILTPMKLKKKIEKNTEKIEEKTIMEDKDTDMCSKTDLCTVEVRDTEIDIKTQCIKIGKPSGKEKGTLRNVYGVDMDLKKWMANPENLYVGRHGRVFIDGDIFTYPESKWHNPYKVGEEYTLEESLRKYKKHIKKSGLYNDLEELKGKTLGCFCDQSGGCHAKVLAEMYHNKISDETGIETEKISDVIEKKEITMKTKNLAAVIKNKRKEIIKYYKKLEEENKHNFDYFIRYVNDLMYLDEAKSSGRYVAEDINSMKVKKLFKGEVVINIETFLPFLYEKVLKVDKSPEFFNDLLLKYSGWYVVLLQRIYRDYIEDSKFKIKDEPDNEFENIVVIGSGEEKKSPIIPESEKKEEVIIPKKIKKKVSQKNFIITITFGEVAENHAGMEKLGEIASKGLSLRNFENAKIKFEEKGYKVQIIDLVKEGEVEDIEPTPEPAYVMVVRNGINAFLKNDKKDNVENINEELLAYEWDTKAFMRGRVVNKLARYNLNYADFDQEPNYEEKKGRVVNFEHVPMLSEIRKNIPEFLCKKTDNLFAEGNFYYDLKQCGIGFHGDAERRIVVAVRLGDSSTPIHYNWFQRSKPIGKRIILDLKPGDVYAMSHKAVGTDWMKKVIPTLRHSTGCSKYTTIK